MDHLINISGNLLSKLSKRDFVVIPTKHCLNLATAVATMLWDRQYKGWLGGDRGNLSTPGEFEGRGLVEFPDDIVW